MPGFIKTADDEKKWDKAKKAAGPEKWALANYIFHKMKKGESMTLCDEILNLVEGEDRRGPTHRSDRRGRMDSPAVTDDRRERDPKTVTGFTSRRAIDQYGNYYEPPMNPAPKQTKKFLKSVQGKSAADLTHAQQVGLANRDNPRSTFLK